MRFLPFLFLLTLAGCISNDSRQNYAVRHYRAVDNNIRVTGRTLAQDSVTIYWSGTSVMFRVSGGTVKAHFRDQKGDNYFNIIIDGDSTRYIRFDSVKRFYTIAADLPDGEHTVEIIKGTEWDRGRTWFYGIQIAEGDLLPLPEDNGRVIEFFGNSITAGYAIDDNTGGDSPDSSFTNIYPTYASITARHFKADLYATVKSGIGIQVSWFPLIMPEMYRRLDPEDSLSRWNFSSVTPDVVVINLLQNDSWLTKMPEHPSFRQRFGTRTPGEATIISTYSQFVKSVREVYPDAIIICALGSMDATKTGSPWPGYVESAVEQLADPRVFTLFFPYTGKGGHPRRDDNEKMAAQLIPLIAEKTGWTAGQPE